MTTETEYPTAELFSCPCCGYKMAGRRDDPDSWQVTVNPYEPHWRLTGEEQKQIIQLIDKFQRIGIGAGAGLAGVFLGRYIVWPPTDWIWISLQLPTIAAFIALAGFIGMGIGESLSERRQERIRREFFKHHDAIPDPGYVKSQEFFDRHEAARIRATD